MIHVFGDSYSCDTNILDKNINKTAWTDILSNKLDSDINLIAEFGIANEWLLYQYNQNSSNIKEGDVVIIQTTSSDRKWFFKDRPKESNFIKTITNGTSAQEKDALKKYVTYLHNENLDDLVYTAFLYTFLYINDMNARHNVKTIILPGFHGAPGTLGNLTDDVCDKEFKNIDVRNAFYKKHKWDPRLNHMTEENRYILADKLYNNIVKGEQLDLTTGFVHNIYN